MNSPSGSWWKVGLWVIIVIIAVWFLLAVKTVLLPFLLAFIIAILLEPVIQKLRKRGLSRGFSLTLVFLVFFGATGTLIVSAVPAVTSQLSGFTRGLEDMTRQLAAETESQSIFMRWNPAVQAKPSNATKVDRFLSQNRDRLEMVGLPSTRRELVTEYIEPHREKLGGIVRNFFNSFIGILGNAVSQVFLLAFTPIFVLLILKDLEALKVRSASWIPPSIRKETVGLLQDVGKVFLAYIRGITTTVFIWMIISAVTLSLLGIPYALLLALLFGAIYVIPYFGGIMMHTAILLVPAMSGTTKNILFSSSDPWNFGLLCMGAFFVVFMIYDNLINPRIIGEAVGLNPLISMFVVFSGGALLGLVGMIVAYPIAGTVKVILSRILKLTGSAHVDELKLPAVPLRHQRT